MALMEETSSSKICFIISHVDTGDRDKDSLIRSANVKIAKSLLVDKCKELTSSTVEIDEKQDLLNFISSNPTFKIDPMGFDFTYGCNVLAYDKKLAVNVGWIYPEIGELATVYLACKEFLTTDCNYLLYIQDDIVLHHNFYEVLTEYLKEVPTDFDAFFQYVPEPEYIIPKFSTDTKNITTSYQYGHAGCVVLSREGALKAIEHFESSSGVAICLSWFFLKTKLFNCYSLKPYKDQGCRLVNVAPLIPPHVQTIRSPLNYLYEEYDRLVTKNKEA